MTKPAKKMIHLEVLTNIPIREFTNKDNRALLEDIFMSRFCFEDDIFEIHQITGETVRAEK